MNTQTQTTKVEHSFDGVVGALGLNAVRHDTPETLSPKDIRVLRRFVWRNYRAFLGINKQGWFSLSSRKRDVTGFNRFIFAKDKALGAALYSAKDNAMRNKRGAFA